MNFWDLFPHHGLYPGRMKRNTALVFLCLFSLSSVRIRYYRYLFSSPEICVTNTSATASCQWTLGTALPNPSFTKIAVSPNSGHVQQVFY